MHRWIMIAVSLVAQSAWAQVCVRIDESKDTLSAQDRRAARITLEHALKKQGENVVSEGCPAAYTVYHVRLGNTVNVYLSGPKGEIDARAAKLDDLPIVYEQMVRSLYTGKPITGDSDTVERGSATLDQMAPRRVEADNVKYVRLGYGFILGGDDLRGPALGVGWRHELDRFGVEISFLNLIISHDLETEDPQRSDAGITASWIQLMLHWFLSPVSNHSAYLGGGISWGATGAIEDGRAFGGTGIQGQLALGYEMFRASTIRLFPQCDITLPFYMSEVEDGTEDDKLYSPSVAFSLGVGWGKSNTIGVVQR